MIGFAETGAEKEKKRKKGRGLCNMTFPLYPAHRAGGYMSYVITSGHIAGREFK